MPVTGVIAYPSAGAKMGSGAVERRTPHFPAEPESQLPKQNWCWAAVCQSIHWGYHNSDVNQRWIVSKCDPSNVENDKPFHVNFALHDQLNFPLENLSASELSTLVAERCPHFPVPVVIEWANSGRQTHAVCAIGTNHLGGEVALLIYDPLPADKSATGSDLIKLVPISTFEGRYLESTTGQARGRWIRAYAVTGSAN